MDAQPKSDSVYGALNLLNQVKNRLIEELVSPANRPDY